MTGSTFRALVALRDGALTRKSAIQAGVLDELVSGGVVRLVKDGRSWTVQCLSRSLLEGYIKRAVGAKDIDEYSEMFERRRKGETISRAEAAKKADGSKAFGTSVMHGLRLNVFSEIEVTYGTEKVTLVPHRGTCLEVADPNLLVIPKDVTIVGCENYETFILIKDYGYLFKDYGRCVFTYRDTSGRKAYERMAEWLSRIPNRYLHFGDLDLCGINIYLGEFKKRLGERASFYIPKDFEEGIRNGNTRLYDKQDGLRVPDTSAEPALAPVVSAIRKYRQIFEQETLSSIGNNTAL